MCIFGACFGVELIDCGLLCVVLIENGVSIRGCQIGR